MFHQADFYNMQLDSAKLRNYSSIKTKIEMEHYQIFTTLQTESPCLRNAMSKDLSLENVHSNTKRTRLFKSLMTDQKVTQHAAGFVTWATFKLPLREHIIS